MLQIFTSNSKFKKSARVLAILWTLLIFVLCLIPGSSFPRVDIPLVDKWAHVILFGVFAFLWLCGYPSRNLRFLIIILIVTAFFGWLVEYIQGNWVKNRSQDHMDTLADAIGGIVGVLVFAGLSYLGDRQLSKRG